MMRISHRRPRRFGRTRFVMKLLVVSALFALTVYVLLRLLAQIAASV